MDNKEKTKQKISLVWIMITIMIVIAIGIIVYCHLPKGTYCRPKVPQGFKKVETKEASWQEENGIIKGWNSGLVIEDELGNQFVWVPVDNINVKYEKNDLDEVLLDEFSDHLKSLLEDVLPDGISKEAEQVKKYGGFYIARYEAGLPSNITSEKDINAVPVSKQNTIGWNGISYENAKINAEKMYQNKKIQSGLITGTQWDTTMEWLYKSHRYPVYSNNRRGNVSDDIYDNLQGSNFVGQRTMEIGNYPNSKFTISGLVSSDHGNHYEQVENKEKNKSEELLLATGINEKTMLNNIYDMAGNLDEYTTEYFYKDQDSIRFSRGGSYLSSEIERFAATRNYVEKQDETNKNSIGFRVVLYLK